MSVSATCNFQVYNFVCPAVSSLIINFHPFPIFPYMLPPLPPGSKLEPMYSFTELVYRDISWCLFFNPLNTELNPICHLLALLGSHHILYVSRIRVKKKVFPNPYN
jgi:hypothetical protein